MEPIIDVARHTREEIAQAMERNMVGHMSYVAERLPGATVLTSAGLTLVDIGASTDTFNVVCGATLGADTADIAIEEAIAYFNRRNVPFSWWVGPTSTPRDLGARLIAHGLIHAEDETGMVLDLHGLDDGDHAVAGVVVRQARSPTEVADLAGVVAANWDPPDQEVVRTYERAAPILLAPSSPFRLWIAYRDGEPVAACEAFLGEGVAGIYAVVTRSAYRRQGIGTAVTRAALRHARAEGYRVAALQASGQGQRIYERIGFTTCGLFREYKPPSNFS